MGTLLQSLLANAADWKTTAPAWLPAIIIGLLVKSGTVSQADAASVSGEIITGIAVIAGLLGTFFFKATPTPPAPPAS